VGRGQCISSWWENWIERGHWAELGVDTWIILGWVCKERVCIGLGGETGRK